MKKTTFTGHVYLTQAQYDKLKQEGKLEIGSIYHITDVEYLNVNDYIVDSEISETSENPVQNKVIAEALKHAGSNDYNDLENKPTLNGKSLEGEVTLSAADIGLGNVDNTSDSDKPVSTEQRAAIDEALDKAKAYTDSKIGTAEPYFIELTGTSGNLTTEQYDKLAADKSAYIIRDLTWDKKGKFTYSSTDSSGRLIYKSTLDGSGNILSINISTDGSWITYIATYQSESDKVTEITSTSNNIKYPSAKAVYTFVSGEVTEVKSYANTAASNAADRAFAYTDEKTNAFTDAALGTIRGSTVDGEISAGTDGIGKVNGWQSIIDRLDNLEYVPIAINSFTTPTTVYEIGTTLSELTFNWTTNKTPVSVRIDNTPVTPPTLTSVKLTGLSLSASKTFTLTVEDAKQSASKNLAVNFYKGIYYGVGESITTSDEIVALTRKLQSGRATSFTVNAGATQYIWFCLPTDYGTPSFVVGGFEGGFTKTGSVSVTNSSGHTESYDIWKSDNTNLGTTTVTVR